MIEHLSKIISTIFHPIFIPLYGIIMLLNMDYFFIYSQVYKLFVISIVTIFTCIIPAIYTFFLIRKKQMENWEMEKKEERHIIYIITLISFLVCIYILWKIRIPNIVILMAICSFITILSIAIINIFWKISIHAASMGCFTGGVFLSCYFMQINPIWLLVSVLIISGLVCSARLELKAHTIGQVLSGYFLGFFYLCIFPFLF